MRRQMTTAEYQQHEAIAFDLLTLRMTLIQGKLIASRALAKQLEDEMVRAGVPDEGIHGLVGLLASGIEALGDGDLGSALQLLERPMAEGSPAWVRWVAYCWLAQWSARTGSLDDAEDYGASAMELARQLDEQSTSLTQCVYAELEALDGAIQPALDRLGQVLEGFEAADDVAGISLAWLTRARILTMAGFEEEAIEAAERAYLADPTWEAPALFRSRQLLGEGNLPGAADVLRRLPLPHSREVRRELQILSSVEKHSVPLWVIAELQQLQNEPPAEPIVEQLEVLIGQAAGLPHARETLGWKLFQLRNYDKAHEVFESLAKEEELDPELREAVLLGQRCALNAQQRQVRLEACDTSRTR